MLRTGIVGRRRRGERVRVEELEDDERGGLVAEGIAQQLLASFATSPGVAGGMPTLLTQAKRSAARTTANSHKRSTQRSSGAALPPACRDCSVVLADGSRAYCDACFPERRAAVVADFANAGPAALAKRRAEGTDPTHTEEARRKQGLRAASNMRQNAEWERLHADQNFQLDFLRDIQPALQCLPLSKIMDATGLSLRYSSLIRRGLKLPHRRHWANLAQLVPDRAYPSLTKGEMTRLVAPTRVGTLDSRAVES
jgi:hypothetical protein